MKGKRAEWWNRFFSGFGKKIICFLLAGVICSAGLFAQGKKDSKKKSDEQTETVEEKTVVTILNALKSSNSKGKDKDDVDYFEEKVEIQINEQLLEDLILLPD